MAITAEQFATGMTMDEYQAQMTQNKEQFAANIASAPVTPEDVARFAALPEPLECARHHRGLVRRLAGASARPLPPRAGVRRPANVRVFKRDENKDLAAQFPLPTGRVAIPIIVFFDRADARNGQIPRAAAGRP